MNTEVKLRKNGHRHGGGWTPKPLHERKVKVYGYVQRQYYTKVQDMIRELIKPYR